MDIKKHLNKSTKDAFHTLKQGYIGRNYDINHQIKCLKEQYGLERVLRFDLGQNNLGCAPEVAKLLENMTRNMSLRSFLKDYPSYPNQSLLRKISSLHGVSPEKVLISAGIEQMIGFVASAFLSENDRVLINAPSFFLFENYSCRLGAQPVFLNLKEVDNFSWTDETLAEYNRMLQEHKPKVIWMANPNNPTGVPIPDEYIYQIIKSAYLHKAVVVFDEAFGEYTDTDRKINSASAYVNDFPNIIVMRTFSKAHGLASLRIGYAVSSSDELIHAMYVHSYNCSTTQFSLDMANCALEHMDYLTYTRRETEQMRTSFMHALQKLPHIDAVNSASNILMLKHNRLSSNELAEGLEKQGVFAARIPGDSLISRTYIRITLRNQDDNQTLLSILKGLCPEAECMEYSGSESFSSDVL